MNGKNDTKSKENRMRTLSEVEKQEYNELTKDAEQLQLFENVYGYCRISTPKQSIQRQIDNIKRYAPNAVIIVEKYTGKTMDRPCWNRFYKKLKSGDTVIFDDVSRMSRGADEGVEVYFELYEREINLVFLKEHHIDTDSYREAMKKAYIHIDTAATAEGTLIDDIVNAINRFMKAKVESDIRKAFEQAEKEVEYLRQRTREGIEVARNNGKQIGQRKGNKLQVKKAVKAKNVIEKHSKSFGGSLSDRECMELAGVSRNTFYKYKRELMEL